MECFEIHSYFSKVTKCEHGGFSQSRWALFYNNVCRAMYMLQFTVVYNWIFINSLVSSKPTLKKLQQTKIITAAGSKWYELGKELLNEDQLTQLGIIKTNNHEVTRCCAEMFLFWLRSHSTATWQNLVEALKAPGVELNDVAATVESHFNLNIGLSASLSSSTYVRSYIRICSCIYTYVAISYVCTY